MTIPYVLLTAAETVAVAASGPAATVPPAAKVVSFRHICYRKLRSDPYHWMERVGEPEFAPR